MEHRRSSEGHQSIEGTLGSEILEAIMVNTCHYTFFKTQRMHNTKSETQC